MSLCGDLQNVVRVSLSNSGPLSLNLKRLSFFSGKCRLDFCLSIEPCYFLLFFFTPPFKNPFDYGICLSFLSDETDISIQKALFLGLQD